MCVAPRVQVSRKIVARSYCIADSRETAALIGGSLLYEGKLNTKNEQVD